MLRSAMAVLVVAASAMLVSTGEPVKNLSGTWTKSAGDVMLKFEFKGKNLVFTMGDDSKSFKVTADYGLSADGIVFGRISNVEKNGTDDGPSMGDLFSFQVALNKDTLTISELKGTDSDQARQLIQGDYKGSLAKKKTAK